MNSNISTASESISALYGNLDEDCKPWFILWTKPDAKTYPFLLSDVDLAISQAKELAPTKDVYFGVCPQKDKPSKGRGTAEGACVVPGLWFDIDIKGPGHAENRLPNTAEEANIFLGSLPWEPTLIVHTSGGYHVYWLFKEPYVVDTENERRGLQALSAQFHTYLTAEGRKKGWNFDATRTFAQLLRVPETINHKCNMQRPVKIIHYDDNTRYNPDDFESILPAVLPEEITSSISVNYNEKEYPLVNHEPIFDGCSFMQYFRDDAKGLPEPEWTAGLTILGQCEGGKELAHTLSSPYPDYSYEETEKKFQHVLNKLNPQKCETIQLGLGFEGCDNCPHNEKIKSPVQLGAKSETKAQKKLADPKWNRARQDFPRTDFPWEVMDDIVSNIRQLSRSCATSANPLPGVVVGVTASLIGDKYSVSPKDSWVEPLNFWHIDIQKSGSGKSPAENQLCKPLYEFQSEAYRQFQDELKSYNSLPRAQQLTSTIPVERGYITSDYTLEGLSDQISNSPHKGLYCHLSEISAMITGQNQYKNGGTDREGTIKLWEGEPARVTRKGGGKYIPASRVSLSGGIQPAIFKTIFGAKNQLFVADGTICRFLFTYEPPSFYPHTSESWSKVNRDNWRTLLERARSWADSQSTPMIAILSTEAQTRFFDWLNELKYSTNQYPDEFQGILPKAFSYCLRLTGIIHCINQFQNQQSPSDELQLDDLEKGIAAIEFYLGQAVDAMTTLLGVDISNSDEGQQKKVILREALNQLQNEFYKDRILISMVMDKYNSLSPDDLKFKNEKAIAKYLREIPLNAPKTSQKYFGISKTCLVNDEMLRSFLSTSTS